jgi:hypothetical protein
VPTPPSLEIENGPQLHPIPSHHMEAPMPPHSTPEHSSRLTEARELGFAVPMGWTRLQCTIFGTSTRTGHSRGPGARGLAPFSFWTCGSFCLQACLAISGARLLACLRDAMPCYECHVCYTMLSQSRISYRGRIITRQRSHSGILALASDACRRYRRRCCGCVVCGD